MRSKQVRLEVFQQDNVAGRDYRPALRTLRFHKHFFTRYTMIGKIALIINGFSCYQWKSRTSPATRFPAPDSLPQNSVVDAFWRFFVPLHHGFPITP